MTMKLTSLNVTLAFFLVRSIAHGATVYSFGPTGGSVVTIADSDDGSGNAITYSSALIQGGTGTAATHEAGSGTVPGTNLGGTYDGTFFDPAVDGDSALTTSIQSTLRQNIDRGIEDDYANYIGIRLSFSGPISLEGFGFIDLDGNVDRGQNEWVASFGTLFGTTVIPTVVLGDSSEQGLRPAATAVDWSGLAGAPTEYGVAYNNNNIAGEDPDSPSTQVSFDYDGALINELYLILGIEGDNTGSNGNNRSGVTGFVVGETVTVPEPSSGILFGLGGLVLLTRHKRA